MPTVTSIGGIFAGLATRYSSAVGGHTVAIQRLPTDPFYTADVTLQNIYPGSSYVILDGDDGSTVLKAAAVADNTTQDDPLVVSAVPAYSLSQLLLVRVRKSTASPYYRNYNTYAFHNAQGVSIYIAQQTDGVLT